MIDNEFIKRIREHTKYLDSLKYSDNPVDRIKDKVWNCDKCSYEELLQLRKELHEIFESDISFDEKMQLTSYAEMLHMCIITTEEIMKKKGT